MQYNQSHAASDYLSNDSENNGNGKGKAFSIGPAKDPATQKILDSRNDALGDPDLTRSERAFVCFVIDRALHPKFFDEKGVVCMADSIPAEKLGVTERMVYNWRHTPATARYFWLSKKTKKNMWPMMVYHLTALHSAPQGDHRTDADGTYGGGSKMRSGPDQAKAAAGRERRNAALAAKRAQQNLPLVGGFSVMDGSPPEAPTTKSVVLQGISADIRSNFRPSAEIDFGSPPKPISAQSRNEFRLPAETNFGGEPKPISAEGRNELPPSAEVDCRHIETQNPIETVRGDSFKRLGNRAKAAEGNRANRRKGWQRRDTQEFLTLCREVLTAGEVEKNSGIWVENLHADPAYAWKVIHDTAAAKTEGRIKTTPAKYAMDAWVNERLGPRKK